MSGNAANPGQGRTALVVGVNGQDGSYLAERLAHNQWRVVGMGRQGQARAGLAARLAQYCPLDLTDTAALQRALHELRPDAIFFAAAVHGAAGFDYESVWLGAHQVNTLALHAALEHARTQAGRGGGKVQVLYFGSAKMFGDLAGRTIDESTPRVSSCIYSITKNAGADLVQYYRATHGVDAGVVWLFNHESERRPPQFFAMQVVQALAQSLQDKRHAVTLNTLDFWCDWGHAQEYMTLVADHCDALRGHDVVLATGHTVWAADVVTELFALHGLAAADHFRTTAPPREKQLATQWRADTTRLVQLAGQRPALWGVEVFQEILRAARTG
ncbi:MAG: GDP-mannose 4,6-dehydratase [Ramlibacter sp.]